MQSRVVSASQYKAFSFLSMLYITFVLAANVLIYKLIHIGSITMTVGSFVTPFWFITADIIAEVYGYQLARRLIWSGILCSFIFMGICFSLIHLPSPSFWQYQSAYNQVLGKLPRVFVGSILGIVIAAFMNSYFITKTKILVHGKYFWVRSVASSVTGQLIFTAITIVFDLMSTLPFHQILQFILISISIKIIITSIVALPSSFIVYYLKKLENIDVYDFDTNFNPFKLEVKAA